MRPGEKWETLVARRERSRTSIEGGAPDRAFALRATTTDPFGNEKFLLDMVRHRHVAAAVDYLTQWSEDGTDCVGSSGVDVSGLRAGHTGQRWRRWRSIR
jgi:hypothetical protein